MEGLIKLHNTLHHLNGLNMFARVVTILGDVGCIWLITAFILFLFKKTRRCSIALILSLAVGYVFNNLILKNIFNRMRPFVVNEEFKEFILSLGMKLPMGSSFPSGHAFSSFCSATVIFIFFKKPGIIAYAIALLIALSRIYLCVHYPTDVIAGSILGVVFAIITYYIFRLIEKKYCNSQREKVRNKDV